MKTATITFLCLSFLCLPLFAGEEIPDTRKNELSLNVSFFIKDFLSLNESSLSTQSPFLINYRHYFGKYGLRTGVGFDVSNSKDSDVNDFELKIRSHSLDYRLGFEHKSRIGNRWILNYGVDGIFSRSKSTVISDNGFDVTTDIERSNGGGGGPFIGISFLITERIRLYTESSIYYIHSGTIDETLFEAFPEFDIKNRGTSDELDLNLPTSIFFAVTF